MILLFAQSPLGKGFHQSGSSPPSPVLERVPRRFMPTASVRCASGESEPSDIAVLLNRLMMALTGST